MKSKYRKLAVLFFPVGLGALYLFIGAFVFGGEPSILIGLVIAILAYLILYEK